MIVVSYTEFSSQLEYRRKEETLLGIDTRFAYLPKFKYYDITKPEKLDKDFRVVIFYLPID